LRGWSDANIPEDPKMTVEIASVTFDCADALTVGRFWSAALGRPLDPKASSDFATIGFAGRRNSVGWAPVERDDDPTWMFAKVWGFGGFSSSRTTLRAVLWL
jgi:hypothetical protein